MSKLKWLQLSDIHFQNESNNNSWLRDMLPKYLKNNKIKCDFIVVTGDLLHRGEGNYKEIEKYLDEISLIVDVDKEDIFIIPGNHDLKRSEERLLLLDGIMNSNSIEEKVNGLSDKMLQRFITDQEEFWIFHNSYLNRNDRYENIHFISEREDYNIINLNTCLICGNEKEEGNLSINTKKLREVISKIENNNKPNIAIGHHGLECFNKEEQKSIIYLFDDYNIDLYLCGHMHKSNINVNNDGTRNIRSIVCGANMKDDFADASIVIGTIDNILSNCSIEYHKWSTKSKKWIKDNEVHRQTNNDGEMSFTLDRLQEIGEDFNQISDMEKEIEILTKPIVKTGKFQKFLLDFYKEIQYYESTEDDITIQKDVEDKFINMKCCDTLVTEFNSLAEYFSLIDKILLDTSYVAFDRKNLIPGTIKTTYYKVLNKNLTGTEIMSDMVRILSAEYSNKVDIDEEELREYFKIIICWSINACSIYNETK